MKIKLGLSSIVVALCGTMQAFAHQTAPNDQSPGRDDSQNGRYHLGKLEKADKIIDMEVKDSGDQKLGKVKDLAVDLGNGRIVEVIVGTGVLPGADERFVAVPPQQFTCDAAAKALQLNVDQTQFNNAPAFSLSNWMANVDETNVLEVYHYYGTQPYFTNESSAKAAATPAHAAEALVQDAARANVTPCYLGEVRRATKLIGARVRNLQGEKIGKAENLMVDLPGGRVVEVVVASGGFLGMGGELSGVPPQSFHTGAEPDALVLDTTKEAFASAPHFKAAEWSSVNNIGQVGTVYHAYNVEPYFDTNAVDNTAQNVRDREDNAITPLKQGTSQADVDMTRQIRKQIIAADGLSINARNVKIITIDGRVTLRGPVNSQEEKQRIGDIAAAVASPANVDNQLQVENLSPTSSAKQ